jgi:peroxiredoxin
MQFRPITALTAAIVIAAAGTLAGCGGGDTGQESSAYQEESGMAQAEPAAGAAAQPAAVGQKAPDFTLTDLDGREYRLSDYTKQGKVVVLEWFNPDCPFVVKHHAKTESMAGTYAAASSRGAVWLAINSGAPGKQGYGLERNKSAKADYGMDYPILLDESGKVGKMYGAKTTPHMFIIDSEGTLVYEGAIDDAPNADPASLGTTNYVKRALDELFGGREITAKETQSYGCSVKYAS